MSSSRPGGVHQIVSDTMKGMTRLCHNRLISWELHYRQDLADRISRCEEINFEKRYRIEAGSRKRRVVLAAWAGNSSSRAC